MPFKTAAITSFFSVRGSMLRNMEHDTPGRPHGVPHSCLGNMLPSPTVPLQFPRSSRRMHTCHFFLKPYWFLNLYFFLIILQP